MIEFVGFIIIAIIFVITIVLPILIASAAILGFFYSIAVWIIQTLAVPKN